MTVKCKELRQKRSETQMYFLRVVIFQVYVLRLPDVRPENFNDLACKLAYKGDRSFQTTTASMTPLTSSINHKTFLS